MKTISHAKIENFLSLREVDLELRDLNVLVGPNGAGKSNILHVFEFLGEVARLDLVPAIDAVGGIDQIRFRGDRETGAVKIELEANVTTHASPTAPDIYHLSFFARKFRRGSGLPTRVAIYRTEEIVLKRTKGRGRRITLRGGNVDFTWEGGNAPRGGSDQSLSLKQDSSGLATIRRLGGQYDAEQVEMLAQVFESLRLYEINVERARQPSPVQESTSLNADASNLASFLAWLYRAEPDIFQMLSDDVRHVFPSFRSFVFEPIGGSQVGVQVSIAEAHFSDPTPLARASFGTLRAIALFAMLHDPTPPKLTCLEEIDHGLHPHALDRIVERLREASSRTQIIVATHSPALVNRVNPEELIIVERNEANGGTRAFRPSLTTIRQLQGNTDYQLGELWFSGVLGGGL